MQNEVVVSLMGGLGNQLFSYAAGQIVANRTNATLTLDSTRVAHMSSSMDTITAFDLPVRHISLKMSTDVSGLISALNTRVAWKVGLRSPVMAKRLKLHMPTSSWSDPEFHGLAAPLRLRGFYQDPSYLEELWPDPMQRRLTLKRSSEWLKAQASRAREENPMAIHMRRGDYRSNKVWGPLSARYFRTVVNLEFSRFGERPVWVFSDDPHCLEELGLKGALLQRSPHGAAEDLVLMSYASAIAISNSTFSWWGAWMSHPSTRVYAPAPWFRNGMEGAHLILPSWNQERSDWE